MPVSKTDAYESGQAIRIMETAGLAVTMPRLAVWIALKQSDTPLSAMVLHRRLMATGVSISLSSVSVAGVCVWASTQYTAAALGLRLVTSRRYEAKVNADHFIEALLPFQGVRERRFVLHVQGRRRVRLPLADHALAPCMSACLPVPAVSLHRR